VRKDLAQQDLFVADLVDVSVRGEMSSMEFPLFSLSTKPDTEIFRYTNPDTGDWIEIIPSANGRATQHDKDILIYATSQIVAAAKEGRPVSRLVKIKAHDYLVSTARNVSGKSYDELMTSLARLRGTTFKASIDRFLDGKNEKRGEVFGLINEARVLAKDDRMIGIEIEISERLFNAISNKHVLTYNPEYYKIRSPVTRRLYELCRKHCGNQAIWEIGFAKLKSKVGSKANDKEFRRMLKATVQKQPIPDYHIDYRAQVKGLPGREKVIIMLDKDGEIRRAEVG
jgi:plasmid replication initiation protein